MSVKAATGSGSAAAPHAIPREVTGGSRTSARGHSSWFSMAATSLWYEAGEGRNAGRRLFGCRRVYKKGRRESPRQLTGRGTCSPPSSPRSSHTTQSDRREDWKYGTVGQSDRQERGLIEMAKSWKSQAKRRPCAVTLSSQHSLTPSGAPGVKQRRERERETGVTVGDTQREPITAKPNRLVPHLYFSPCGQVVKSTQKKCSHTD